ncbi:hypothetical protein [Streptomyces sp. NPDC127084]|uniref:hypothetical protein n=1 Tax=Streptomyces sp. NPDC127084 TaxID=3347133 RepID=UPI00365AE7CE
MPVPPQRTSGGGTTPAAPPSPPSLPPLPVGRTSGAVPPRPASPPPAAGQTAWLPPTVWHGYPGFHTEQPTEITTRLRPVRTRHPARTPAAVACLVLGLGLIGGAAAGSWLVDGSTTRGAASTAAADYDGVRALWHSTPVDELFPRTLKGPGSGPGGADRVWKRLGVAPDTECAAALDPLLAEAVRPVGCLRALRATYADASSSGVTTVGMLFTQADRQAMATLRGRFTRENLDQRADLMPRAYAVPGTVAAGFGDEQRASWTIDVLSDAPVLVYAVSGFADGRTVTDPRPASEATIAGATSAPAQSGLGHEARGLAGGIERALRASAAKASEQPE